MEKESPKEWVLRAVRDLHDDVTFEEVVERLYFLGKIEVGLRQADRGETMSCEEARRSVLG